MSAKPRHALKNILHPYIFFLKEGGEIKKNFLDYSLMMLYVHSSETIKSPEDDILSRSLAEIEKISRKHF